MQGYIQLMLSKEERIYQKIPSTLKYRAIIIGKYRAVILSFCLSIVCNFNVKGQTSISNSNARNVLHGNYDPSHYHPSVLIHDKDSVIDGIVSGVSEDSLLSYLTVLESFGNRNSGSDTLSDHHGIGAARRWIFRKFTEFSLGNENRLEVAYMTFFKGICGQSEHRNVMAVLPGLDTSRKDLVFIEAHMDSRCEGACDTSCYAPGMDDNGSGTALVLELARVMSAYAFDRTMVFTTVTGEEQGLLGGSAWAKFFYDNDIDVLACLNNDIVGGVECGQRSSPPSCSPAGSIDSLNLRVFSFSPQNDSDLVSPAKQLARYVKLQQIEEINSRIQNPVNLSLQIKEDRSGRGGDHIPFRQYGFTSIRFTSANEYGDGSGQPGDRQHSVNDLLGLDTSLPPDGILDTFFIDFSYLRKNSFTNGVNLALLANSPPVPDPVYNLNSHGNLQSIEFTGPDSLYSHRIGLRKRTSPSLYFDTVLSFNKNVISYSELAPGGDIQIHCMNVERGIESIPQVHHSEEYLSLTEEVRDVNCLRPYPNPASAQLSFNWTCHVAPAIFDVYIFDLQGNLIFRDRWKGSSTYQMDSNVLTNGCYEFVFRSESGDVFKHKIVIKH